MPSTHVLSLTLAALVGATWQAWPLAGADALPGDGPTLARLARRHPCPAVIPIGWTRADPSLGRPPWCHVVAAAAGAIRRAPALRWGPRVNPDAPTCVRVLGFALRDLRTGRIDAPYWSVEFYSDRLPWARVVVDRRTGRATAERYGNEFGMPFAEFCPPAA